MTIDVRALPTPPPSWSDDRVRALVEPHAAEPGGLLPALHALQAELGCIDPAAIPVLADVFNLSRAEVHGVVSFYRDFRTEAPMAPIVRVCRGEACQSVGAERLVEHARRTVTEGHAAVELDDVFCLGNCALGPSVLAGGRVHGRTDEAMLDGLMAAAAAAAATPPAPPAAAGSGTSRPDDRMASNAPDAVALRTATVFVPRDSAARAVGADEVADALRAAASRHGIDLDVVRTGSRGMVWLEPMIELATPEGRIAYGPISPTDVDELVAAGLFDGAPHPTRLGSPDELDWMRRQQRVTFARVGVVDPRSPEDFERHGGLAGLRAALAMSPAAVVDAVTESGLRGRGGAAFPAGVKWRTVLEAPGSQKYVCCNADEGDSGTFADRMLMEGDPFTLLEGMVIAGYSVGAGEGYVYVRSEYPDAIEALHDAVAAAYDRGWLGPSVLGSGFGFDVFVRIGAGSYVCGEETAMLESLEGKRGEVRAKPPLPAHAGLFGRPTLVNNVLTLAAVPGVVAGGPDAYAALGVGRSRGTQAFQLAGNIRRGGLFEAPLGITLRELVEDLGGGTRSGRPVRAVQVGGPLGAYLPVSLLDVPADYEALAEAGGLLGHGGIVVFDDSVDMTRQARFAMEFCAHESCGKCTPCRIGSVRGVEVIDRIIAGDDRTGNLVLLDDLCEVMADGSLCAMGGLTPLPVRSALAHFGEDFHRTPERGEDP